MREIIHIQVGQCGNQIGTQFWQRISQEHDINVEGRYCGDNPDVMLSRSDVYWNETGDNRFVPRSVCVDLEPGTIDAIKGGPWGKAFDPNSFVNGASGAGNNWAKGYYTEGAELIEEVNDIVRKEAEKADCLQGFQVIHSLGGGTGSGMGTLIQQNICGDYYDRMSSSYAILPSSLISDVIVEPYNALLSLHVLIETAHAVFAMDNEALHRICVNELKNKKPQYDDLNKIICRAMTGVTTCLRLPGQLNADLRKLATNLIPFTRLKFFIPGYAPLRMDSFAQRNANLVKELFNPNNMLSVSDPFRDGNYLTCACIFRGEGLSMREIDRQLNEITLKNRAHFVEWMPSNVKTAVCNVASPEGGHSGTFIGNTSAIVTPIKKIMDSYQKMISKKAFVHWYTSEGMDEQEFKEAQMNINDLCDEYTQYGEAFDDEGENDVDDYAGDQFDGAESGDSY